MTFNPSSTIYLCNVPIDNTYKHQIYFPSMAKQKEYFSQRVVKTFSEYLTVRKTLAGGALQSSIKVNANIDDLYNCNYMYYQNANHGVRYFYAFITKLIYVNEGTTEIVFETDVYQTWRFFTELKESYVVREHSETDEIGDNIVPERFNMQDYVYETAYDDDTFTGDIMTFPPDTKWGYLVASSDLYTADGIDKDAPRGFAQCGIYQGVYFYYFTDPLAINIMLDTIDRDSILFICVLPEFNVSDSKITPIFESDTKQGRISATTASKTITVGNVYTKTPFEGHIPSNKKLYTNPFFNLVITNHSGDEGVYSVEDFDDPTNVKFNMYGDISANPSVTLIPADYKGLANNYDFGISLGSFPQCAFNIDTYKLWLAKNQYGVAINAASAGVNALGGAMLSGMSGNVAGVALSAAHGATQIANTINSVYEASKLPNSASVGNGKNNLLTAIGENKFDYYVRSIKANLAHTIDDFFTMYGYQTNQIKVPNCSSRPYFNYVQTVDVNIIGTIPDDDMTMLKNMYNNGVTLWRGDKLSSLAYEQQNPDAFTVGDYSVVNSPEGV